MSFTLQYHTPPARPTNIYPRHHSAADIGRRSHPHFFNIPIHFAQIPAYHPKTRTIRFSRTRIRFQIPQMYISSPIGLVASIGQRLEIPLSPISSLSLRELSSPGPSLLIPLSSSCDFEAFYRANVPPCTCLRLPLSPPFLLSVFLPQLSPRVPAPFGRTSWSARAFTTRVPHQGPLVRLQHRKFLSPPSPGL